MGRTAIIINADREKKNLEKIGSSEKYNAKGTETENPSYSARLHVFSKGNSFTSSDSTDSDEYNGGSRAQSYCGLLCLSLAMVACIFGCYVMWGTNFFTLFVHQNLAISNNSMRYEAWKSPPVHAYLRVYIFNYTNVEEFEKGIDSELKVQELGPYTYIEKLERVDVKFNENGTATYRDKKSYKFSPEHSRGNESDLILVPNLPFLAAVSLTTKIPMIVRWALMSVIKNFGSPFLTLRVDDFLWGYEDNMSVLTQKFLSLRYDVPFKKFGILSAKNQTQKDLVTIYTGEDDPSKTGIVVTYNGKTSLDYWSSNECNRIDGTDGTVYPPPLVHPNSTLYIYMKDMCRKLPLVYSREYKDKHGIPVLRFRIPKTVFASGYEHKENLCFCNQAKYEPECLPSGIFNVGPCVYEAPVVASLPHFLYGDPILFKGIKGLAPKGSKHESYVEVDPKLGIPIGGKSRLQLNILLNDGFKYIPQYRVYGKQMIFPITWMDYGLDRLPDDVSAMIRSLISFVKVAEFVLSYGFILFVLILGGFLVTGFRQALKTGSDISITETPLVIVDAKR